MPEKNWMRQRDIKRLASFHNLGVLIALALPALFGGFISGAIVARTPVGPHMVWLGMVFYICMLLGISLISFVMSGPCQDGFRSGRGLFILAFVAMHCGSLFLLLLSQISFMDDVEPDPKIMILAKIMAFPIYLICNWLDSKCVGTSLEGLGEFLQAPWFFATSLTMAWFSGQLCTKYLRNRSGFFILNPLPVGVSTEEFESPPPPSFGLVVLRRLRAIIYRFVASLLP